MSTCGTSGRHLHAAAVPGFLSARENNASCSFARPAPDKVCFASCARRIARRVALGLPTSGEQSAGLAEFVRVSRRCSSYCTLGMGSSHAKSQVVTKKQRVGDASRRDEIRKMGGWEQGKSLRCPHHHGRRVCDSPVRRFRPRARSSSGRIVTRWDAVGGECCGEGSAVLLHLFPSPMGHGVSQQGRAVTRPRGAAITDAVGRDGLRAR